MYMLRFFKCRWKKSTYHCTFKQQSYVNTVALHVPFGSSGKAKTRSFKREKERDVLCTVRQVHIVSVVPDERTTQKKTHGWAFRNSFSRPRKIDHGKSEEFVYLIMLKRKRKRRKKKTNKQTGKLRKKSVGGTGTFLPLRRTLEFIVCERYVRSGGD